MRRLSVDPSPTPSTICAGGVPTEMAVRAALLVRKNSGGGGSNSISKFHHHNRNEGAVCCMEFYPLRFLCLKPIIASYFSVLFVSLFNPNPHGYGIKRAFDR
jgi:hypothetical protein